jgi:hypothetical protein
MRIHNLYADENGETHFRDIEIEFTETGPDGTASKLYPATGVIFRTTPGDWFFDWHRTTRRQYVVNLDAPHQVTASLARHASSVVVRFIWSRTCTAKVISLKDWGNAAIL